MCRPVDGFRKETCPGGHVGPPLRGVGSVREPTEIGAGRKHSPAGRDGARPLQKERRRSRRGAPGVWLLPSKFQNGIWGVGRGHRPLRPAGGREGGTPGSSCPTGGCGEPPRLPWVAAHSGASAPRSRGNGRETRQRSPQKCPATPDNPSVGLWPTAPFAQGSLWGRGRGLPRRPCGPPRNDNGFLSFRGQCVHWPWESVLFYDGRGFGPPGRRTLRKARSTTKPAGAQQSVRASGREEWAGIDAGTIKKGQASAIARAALSEAESAERGAGQIRFLPDK